MDMRRDLDRKLAHRQPRDRRVDFERAYPPPPDPEPVDAEEDE